MQGPGSGGPPDTTARDAVDAARRAALEPLYPAAPSRRPPLSADPVFAALRQARDGAVGATALRRRHQDDAADDARWDALLRAVDAMVRRVDDVERDLAGLAAEVPPATKERPVG